MVSDTEIIYQKIADVICQSIHDDWEKAWITAKVLDNFAESEYDYQLQDGTQRWFDPGFENNGKIIDSLRDLRSLMKQNCKKPWCRIVFTLTRNGKFHVDLSYED